MTVFAYWYTLALLLIIVGVFGMMVQLSRSSLPESVFRFTQYLSGIDMLIAAIGSRWEVGAHATTLTQAINKPPIICFRESSYKIKFIE